MTPLTKRKASVMTTRGAAVLNEQPEAGNRSRLPAGVELIYNTDLMEGRRRRMSLSHEDIRAESRKYIPMSRPTVRAVLEGDPKVAVGYVWSVLRVLNLTWADVITVQDRELSRSIA